MSAKLETLSLNLEKHFGERIKSKKLALGEVTIEVAVADYIDVMQTLRDEADFRFDEIADLCGIDYSTYGNGQRQGLRYAVVVHLLSVANNLRLRVRVLLITTISLRCHRLFRCGPVPIGSSGRRLICLALFSRGMMICAGS